ncbi:MAG: sel1 repeat family protein, partial [Paludibacteraceae bacterium]|nr:sel1 repeat family protein [Paludibacteraceae bacterium]
DEKAAELFRKAAEWGIEEGMLNLSKMYFEGVGVEKDSMKAWEWNEKALNLGFVPSRHLLAVMLMNGIGKDEVKRGEFYLELAAEDGYGPAVKLKAEKEQERR